MHVKLKTYCTRYKCEISSSVTLAGFPIVSGKLILNGLEHKQSIAARIFISRHYNVCSVGRTLECLAIASYLNAEALLRACGITITPCYTHKKSISDFEEALLIGTNGFVSRTKLDDK